MSRDRPPHIIPGSVDSHFHTLVMEEKGLGAIEILRECFEAEMAYGLDVAVSLEDFEERRSRLAHLDRVYLTGGLHPSNAGSVSFETQEPKLREALSMQKVVALGEIGLDWYRNHGTPQQQRDLFVSQIELANELRMPVVIHNRDATSDILDVFAAHPPAAESVMHCFSARPRSCEALPRPRLLHIVRRKRHLQAVRGYPPRRSPYPGRPHLS
ncbi:MAG: TatD family hydrolase [Halomonas sp.]|uniref:TatD family hydrolase n=1 Tax=Halomonas sp. TaxID=1486246 RepID=UPI002ACEAFE3|nr:TatD family hydrolase [Halomonas sp.]MDZ7852559.1 TatD family hydrolase [Halomonas sp.]